MRSDVSEYELVAPGSLDAVLALLAEEPGAWTPIAGGTELMVALGAGACSSTSWSACGASASCDQSQQATIG
jgi:CO/xanthine dehydrogenase FAD-binding subunit